MEGRPFAGVATGARRPQAGGLPKTLDFGSLPDTLEDCDEDEWKRIFGVFLERCCTAQIEGIIEKIDATIHYGVTIRYSTTRTCRPSIYLFLINFFIKIN
jgi:hypothetical protein